MNLKKAIYYITHWETWNWLAKYVPIMPAWFWFCLKSGSLWFFTSSNPSIAFGGFLGESKKKIYDQLPPGSYPRSICINPSIQISQLKDLIDKGNFTFPVAVKPDVGMMGFMFRKINNSGELYRYHAAMVAEYILQEFILYPLEVSVFYYRFPHQTGGAITGFVRKEFLKVTGDGKSTLRLLVEKYPRVAFRQLEMKRKHSRNLDNIIPAGEEFYLSQALNLSRGGKLISLEHEKDERLLKVFDDLSLNSSNFFFGRYDIKCSSIEDLKSGKNFSILEYNGSGAEPHHIYGNGNTLLQAYSILLKHWKILYSISRENHKNGITYWPFRQGLVFFNKANSHFRELRRLDLRFEV